MLSSHGESALNYHIGLGKSLRHVAFAPGVPHEGVGHGIQEAGQTGVAVDVGM